MNEAINASNAEMQMVYGITVDGVKLFFKAVGQGASLSITAAQMIGRLIQSKNENRKADKVLNSLETKDGAKFYLLDSKQFNPEEPKTVASRLNELGVNWRMVSDGVNNGKDYLVVPGKDAEAVQEVLKRADVELKETFTVKEEEAEATVGERTKEQQKEDVVHEEKKEGPKQAEKRDPAIEAIVKDRKEREEKLNPSSSEVRESTPEKKSGSQSKSTTSKESLEVLYEEGKKEAEKHNAKIDSLNLPAQTMER